MAKISVRGREHGKLLQKDKSRNPEKMPLASGQTFSLHWVWLFLAHAEWIWKARATGSSLFCSVLVMQGLSHGVSWWRVNGSRPHPDKPEPRGASLRSSGPPAQPRKVSAPAPPPTPQLVCDPQTCWSTGWLIVLSYSARQTQAVDGVFSGNFLCPHNSPLSLCLLCSSYPGSLPPFYFFQDLN